MNNGVCPSARACTLPLPTSCGRDCCRRSSLPLPVTRSTPWRRLTAVAGSSTSSLTRSPAAYISSSMARSRRPSALSMSGAASSASIWLSASALGSRRGSFGGSSNALGSSPRSPRRTPSAKNARSADSRRALLRGDQPWWVRQAR
ncbi:hypothetical protein G6F46_014236 [Rhizopus delemar]|nr:hypothetical protein G6F46_014236 [Rhizopus delemar]